MTTYVLVLVAMYFSMHPVTFRQLLGVITLPLCAAVFISAGINLRLRKPSERKYYWRMLAGIVAYALSIKVANDMFPDQHHKYWLIFLPILPIIFIVATIIGSLTALDELKRKIVTEAAAFAGLATGFTCFSYIFLRDMGAPEFHGEWAFYIMTAYYFIGLFFSWRRYR